MRKGFTIREIEKDLNKDFVAYIEQENLYQDGLDTKAVNFIKKLART